MTTEEKKMQQENPQHKIGNKSVVALPKGTGRLKEKVVVKATQNHPFMSVGKEYKTHPVHVPYLIAKGYIEDVNKRSI